MKVNSLPLMQHSSNRKKIAFKGEYYDNKYYTDTQIEKAKLYMYVEDYSLVLWDELFEEEDGFFTSFDTANKRAKERFAPIETLIKYFQKINKERTSKLENINNEMNIIKIKQDKLANDVNILKENVKKEKEIAKKKKEELESYLGMRKRYAEVKKNITEKFISLSGAEQMENENKNSGNIFSNKSNIIYPNGILISGLDKESMQRIAVETANEANFDLKNIDFGTIDKKDAIKTIGSIAKNAQNSNKRCIIHVENFDKHTLHTEGNQEFIGKLKAFLSDCALTKNCTILLNTDIHLVPPKNGNFDKSKYISSEVLADQRFKYKFDVNNIKYKYKPQITEYNEGYNFRYGLDNDENVNLYLADWNRNPYMLWVDSCKNKDIKAVSENIDKIKELEHFKLVHKIQCPEPENPEELTDFKNIYVLSKGVPIYEKKLY